MGNDGSGSSFGEIVERTMNFLPPGQQKYLSQRSERIWQILPRRSAERAGGVGDTLVCVSGRGDAGSYNAGLIVASGRRLSYTVFLCLHIHRPCVQINSTITYTIYVIAICMMCMICNVETSLRCTKCRCCDTQERAGIGHTQKYTY